MKHKHLISLVILAASSFAAHGQASTPRALFEAGGNAYLKDGGTAAMKAWLAGSGLEGNTQANSQANTLRQIEDFYGKPEGFEIISESSVSERVKMVLAVMHYQKGPLFARAQFYKLSAGGWVSSEVKFHTEAAQIFPPAALYGRQ